MPWVSELNAKLHKPDVIQSSDQYRNYLETKGEYLLSQG